MIMVKIIATTCWTLATCEALSSVHGLSAHLILPPVPIILLIHVFDRSQLGAYCVRLHARYKCQGPSG